VKFDDFIKATHDAKSFDDFAKIIGKITNNPKHAQDCLELLERYEDARRDFNLARGILGLKYFRQRRAHAETSSPTRISQEDSKHDSSADSGAKV
jgi:hypothetical protein